MSRYTYLGDAYTDARFVGAQCEPVRRADGKCIVSTRMATALVTFDGEDLPRVVKRRRLRVNSVVRLAERGARRITESKKEKHAK